MQNRRICDIENMENKRKQKSCARSRLLAHSLQLFNDTWIFDRHIWTVYFSSTFRKECAQRNSSEKINFLECHGKWRSIYNWKTQRDTQVGDEYYNCVRL